MWENQLNNEEKPSSSLTAAELQLRASKGLLVVRTRVSSVMRIYMYVIPEWISVDSLLIRLTN